MILEKNKKTSQFFTFDENYNNLFELYEGWNNSILVKFNLNHEDTIDNLFFQKKIKKISNKEKILVVVSGGLEISKNGKKIILREYDALNFNFYETNFKIKSLSNSLFYLVSSTIIPEKSLQGVYFNFKHDIPANDIWGGQCISRPYVGRDLNLVLFDLKPGFKFEDSGHENEQITWLIQGSMDFKCENLFNKLTIKNGVDIGPNHRHGGVSNGAVGFDAFFPKRQETEYKQKINSKKNF